MANPVTDHDVNAAPPGIPPRRPWVAIVLAGFGAAVLLVLAYTAYWFSAANELRHAAERWRGERRAQGEIVTWQGFALGGYPFWLRVTATSTLWARGEGERAWSWEASRVEAKVRPWQFQRVNLDLTGEHRIAWTDGAHRAAYTVTADRLTSLLAIAAGKVGGADVDLAGLHLDGGPAIGAWSLEAGRAAIRRPAVPPADHLGESWTVAFDGSGLGLPEAPVLPLGNRVARAVFDSRVLGAIAPGPLDVGLAQWRDDGGTVEVKHLRLDWGPLSAQGDGTLALDATLQPIGAFATQTQGFLETVDLLRRQGLVDGQAALTARLVLGVMSRPSSDGGPPTISLPISIQNRTVFAGPVAVLRLDPIRWTGTMPAF